MKKEDTPPAEDAPEMPADIPSASEPVGEPSPWLNLHGAAPHAAVAALLLLALLLGYALTSPPSWKNTNTLRWPAMPPWTNGPNTTSSGNGLKS